MSKYRERENPIDIFCVYRQYETRVMTLER